MANKPDIPRQSLANFYAAQNSHQGHDQGITGWHPQMTQSLGACALHSLQVAIPPQQSPPKVGTPVKRIKDLVFTHGQFIAGSVKFIDRYSPTITTRLRSVLRRCFLHQFFFCVRRSGIEGNRISDRDLSVS
jgi:hypothetical protein